MSRETCSLHFAMREEQTKPNSFSALLSRLPILFLSVSLVSCSDYPDTKMVCNGDVTVFGSEAVTEQNERIAFSIRNDTLSLSGNNLFFGANIKVCKMGQPEFPNKDELIFDTSGCSIDKTEPRRTYGTYNFLLKELNVSDENNHLLRVSGKFNCSEAN